MSNATPRPWFIGKSYTDEPAIRDEEGECVAVACALLDGEALANAALIVEAVNSHDALQAENVALRKVIRDSLSDLDEANCDPKGCDCSRCEAVEMLRAALKSSDAKGNQSQK